MTVLTCAEVDVEVQRRQSPHEALWKLCHSEVVAEDSVVPPLLSASSAVRKHASRVHQVRSAAAVQSEDQGWIGAVGSAPHQTKTRTTFDLLFAAGTAHALSLRRFGAARVSDYVYDELDLRGPIVAVDGAVAAVTLAAGQETVGEHLLTVFLVAVVLQLGADAVELTQSSGAMAALKPARRIRLILGHATAVLTSAAAGL